MSDSGKSSVRNSILGADRVLRIIDGGGGGANPPASGGGEQDPCPVTGLGDDDATLHFLDTIGQKRSFTAKDLGNRQTLLKLFRGDEDWLRRRFPVWKEFDDGNGGKERKIVDFRINEASRFFIHLACSKGIFGSSTMIRRTGIWRSDDGQPIIHCGDKVLIETAWHDPGIRTGRQIWAAAEATPRPGVSCDHSVAEELQQRLGMYWNYRSSAAPIAIIGLLYSGYLCGALKWRGNAFVTGPSRSGKTELRKVFRAAWPLHYYTNDTTKPGIEQAVNGRAVPAVIDEANDRNRSSGLDLIDIVLSASGDEGTKGGRGTIDGKGRTTEVLTSVVMFSIDPPELQPQHMNRFTLIELQTPDDGVAYQAEHAATIEFARVNGPALWGRAISAWERYNACIDMFRLVLRQMGCDPREQDGKSALLAGWHVMVKEGLPSDRDLREGVAAISDYIVTAQEARQDDGPRRALAHLLNHLATLHRSTDRDSIGLLLDIAFNSATEYAEGRDPTSADQLLQRYGIRPVRRCDRQETTLEACECPRCWDSFRKKRLPRLSKNDGLYIATRHQEVDKIFHNTAFDGGRWRHQLMRLPSARPSGKSIRIGGGSGHAFWLEAADLWPDDGDM